MAHTDLVSLFTDIANAIRAKKGTSSSIVADNFPNEIASIPTGGGGTDVSDTTAVESDVRSGEIFHKADGSKATGTVAVRSSSSVTSNNLTVTVPKGIYDSAVTKTLTDSDLKAENVKIGVNIFGIDGSFNGFACMTYQTITPSSDLVKLELSAVSALNGRTPKLIIVVASGTIHYDASQRYWEFMAYSALSNMTSRARSVYSGNVTRDTYSYVYVGNDLDLHVTPNCEGTYFTEGSASTAHKYFKAGTTYTAYIYG